MRHTKAIRGVSGVLFLLVGNAALADGYGLVAGEGPGTRAIGGAQSAGGYGLVPSAIERHGVERIPRAEAPGYRSQINSPQINSSEINSTQASEKRYLSSADRAAYVVPAARPALKPAMRPVAHQPRPIQPQQLGSLATANNSRYGQVQLDTRKNYSVSVSAQQPLSDLMRAPVTFAKPQPQPVRSLSQLQHPQPAVTTAQPVLPPDLAAARLPVVNARATGTNNTRTTGIPATGIAIKGNSQPDFSALKARLKPQVGSVPATANAAPAASALADSALAGSVVTAAAVMKGKPDFSALKARIKAPTSAPVSVSASIAAADRQPDFSALQQQVKAALPVANTANTANTAATSASPVERKTSALPSHAGRRTASIAPAVATEKPVQLSTVTSTASRSGINGILDSVAQMLGAEPVKPWQKATLAEQAMKKGGAIPALSKFSQKVHISKEASRGGYGVAGGGCGCN
ncbi:MAG: DUF4266 domain-containing protein [Marinobacterium sp.]|nr:DUF4266 domain-containing protein [Marinobacterium sp.]